MAENKRPNTGHKPRRKTLRRSPDGEASKTDEEVASELWSSLVSGAIQGLAFRIASGGTTRKRAMEPRDFVVDAERTGGMHPRTCSGNHYLCGARTVLDHWKFCPYCATELRAVQ